MRGVENHHQFAQHSFTNDPSRRDSRGDQLTVSSRIVDDQFLKKNMVCYEGNLMLYKCVFRYRFFKDMTNIIDTSIWKSWGTSVVLGGNSGWFYAPEALTQAAHDRGMYILIAWSLNFLFRIDRKMSTWRNWK